MNRLVVASAVLARILILVGLLVAVYQWVEIGYRIKLYRDSGSVPYTNHIGDGGFALAYAADAFVIVTGLIAIYLLRKASTWAKFVARCSLVLNAAGLLTLFVMCRTGVLVEYTAFVRHMGP